MPAAAEAIELLVGFVVAGESGRPSQFSARRIPSQELPGSVQKFDTRKAGLERNRPVNSFAGAEERVREFWRKIRGSREEPLWFLSDPGFSLSN